MKKNNFKINLLVSTSLVILFLIILSCTEKKIIITTSDDVEKIIEAGKKGDVFLLKEGVYLNISEIEVPNGVAVEGEKKTVFTRTKSFNGLPIFNISNSSDVVIKNITFNLFSNSKGILSKSEKSTNNIKLKNLNFNGNLNDDTLKRTDQSNISISWENIVDLESNNISFKNTFGGIYLNKITNGVIKNNNFDQVNFGNIVVSSSTNIIIDSNNISQAGKGSKYHHPSGDGMSFGGENNKIQITNNTISHGYCYLIWVVGSINNSKISNNVFNSGVTTSLCINNGNNIDISNNKFIYGLANGILLNDDYDNVIIKNNEFYNDGIISRSGNSKNIQVLNNTFEENFKGERFIGIIGNVTKNEKNKIDIKSNNTDLNFVLIDEKNNIINSGDTYNLTSDKMTFKIKNKGFKKLSFTGFPQVILSDTILEKNSRGARKSGFTQNGGFYINSRHQPNVLTLNNKDEEADFTINSSSTQDSTILNIPSSFESLNPFWIKITKTKEWNQL